MAWELGAPATIVACLSITVVQLIAALLLTAHWIKRHALRRLDSFIVLWLVWDGIVHFTLEGSFLVVSFTVGVENSNSFIALPWKEYGRADRRWSQGDLTILSLEVLTVGMCAPLCFALVYAICKKRPWKHFVQITLCVMELYGGWMTFGPEWLSYSPNLVTSDPILLWLYLVFFNMLWVIIPVALLWQSWQAMLRVKWEKTA